MFGKSEQEIIMARRQTVACMFGKSEQEIIMQGALPVRGIMEFIYV